MIDDVVKMEQAGFPVYSTAEMAAEVLGQMYHYGVRRQSALTDSIARHLTKDAFSVDNNPVRLRLINPKDIGPVDGFCQRLFRKITVASVFIAF